jgi:mRNA interferase MazF
MVNRGEIWWADLGEPSGSAPGFSRPVLVIQANSFNHSRISTVIVIALSSNLKLADAPGNTELTARQTGLSKDSVANVSQVLTLDKQFLRDKSGELSPKFMRLIDQGLHVALDL